MSEYVYRIGFLPSDSARNLRQRCKEIGCTLETAGWEDGMEDDYIVADSKDKIRNVMSYSSIRFYPEDIYEKSNSAYPLMELKNSTKKMKKFVASDRRNYRVLLGGTEIIIPQSENGNDDSEIEEYVKHVVDDADRAKLLEICRDNWELFGMYMMDVEEMFDEDPEYYKSQIVEWITSLLYNHVFWGKNYTEPYFGITVEVQDMDSEAEDRMYYASTKKMKKSYGNYIDAIENFIVDCPDGCYYNAIFDEFSDVLSEDEVMDALGTLMDDNIVCYNENNEKFEVCEKARKMKKEGIKKAEYITEEEVDDIQRCFDDEGYDATCWVEHSNRLGFKRPWWVIRDVSVSDFGALDRIKSSIIPMRFQYGFDYEFTRHGNDYITKLEFLIPYSNGYTANAKKSYSPDYKDFAGMVNSIRNTGNHRNVFKE